MQPAQPAIRVAFRLTGLRQEHIATVAGLLGLQPSRITLCEMAGRRELSWNYDIASGVQADWSRLEARINEFINKRRASILQLAQTHHVGIVVCVCDDRAPSFGVVRLGPETLLNIAGCKLELGVAFNGGTADLEEKLGKPAY